VLLAVACGRKGYLKFNTAAFTVGKTALKASWFFV
jgi:hypothetical protein